VDWYIGTKITEDLTAIIMEAVLLPTKCWQLFNHQHGTSSQKTCDLATLQVLKV